MADREAQEREAQLLWDQYEKDRCVENKNELLMHYLFLVKNIVLRMMPAYRQKNDYDDLLSNGVIGLMDAIDKFDRVRNVKFETYASKRIRGEILDYMRKQDWISSSMRARIKKVKEAFYSLSVQFGREPDNQEIADFLGFSVQQVEEALENEYLCNIVYFESAVSSAAGEDTFKIVDAVKDDCDERSPERQLEKKETHEMLQKILDQLPEKEKLVIDLYYRKELLLKEIAQILDVTESRVSQIHTKAIKHIETRLKLQLGKD